jgi:hypothetical protein
MPIPLMQTEEAPERRVALRLVSDAAPAARPYLYPRALAHFVDFCVVDGLSLYFAKVFSVLLVSLHSTAIAGSGRVAGPLFREAFAYSNAQLFAASLTAISVLYFVALPYATGRTLGLGLLGLRIRAGDSQPPSVRQLAWRLLGCLLTYATFGALCVVGFRKHDGRFLQDLLSGTRVSKD